MSRSLTAFSKEAIVLYLVFELSGHSTLSIKVPPVFETNQSWAMWVNKLLLNAANSKSTVTITREI